MAWIASDGGATPHATNHVDLLDKFHAFLLDNGAIEKSYAPGVENIVQLVGAGSEEILFGAQVYTNIPGNNYAWLVNGFTGYTDGHLWANQLGAVVNSPAALALWGTTIPYWFFVNSRRALVVAKVSTTYQMAYFGLILPYGTPAQWSYPLCVSGSTYRGDTDSSNFEKPYLFSNSDARTSNFWCPLYEERSLGTLLIRTAGGWRRLRIEKKADFKYSGTFPYYWFYKDNFRAAIDDSYQREAVQILDGGEPSGFLGVFDGLFFVPGVGLSAESVITDPDTAEEFFAFPNTSRESVGNWVLVKKA